MPLLLNIDTATEHASVCLSRDGIVLGLIESAEQKNHASFVQPAIQQIIKESKYTLADIDAVAATSGPGSYTGLRVGLASAKGICYALDKPLILINTLETMAQSILSYYKSTNQTVDSSTLICPLIDARRMEVFTALYDASAKEMEAPHARIIDENSFSFLLEKHAIIFIGTGSQKVKDNLSTGASVIFPNIQHNASHLAILADKSFLLQSFADLAYSEPLYVKEFFNPLKKT